MKRRRSTRPTDNAPLTSRLEQFLARVAAHQERDRKQRERWKREQEASDASDTAPDTDHAA